MSEYKISPNTYKIFRHPQGKMEVVKDGWSWPAFFFAGFWLLFKRMWELAIYWFVFSVLCEFALEQITRPNGYLYGALSVVLGPSMMALFGLKGNEWREHNLISRAYECVGKVTASNMDAALAIYLKGNGGKGEPQKAGSGAARGPIIDIIEEQPEAKVRVSCKACGFDRLVDRSKFGDRTGTVKVRCPNCKHPVNVTLMRSTVP